MAHPNGALVPAEEPAVAAARAAHLAAFGAVLPASGVPAAPSAYSGPLNLSSQLVAHPNGALVPLDEPAVTAARAAHLQAHAAYVPAAAPVPVAAPAPVYHAPAPVQATAYSAFAPVQATAYSAPAPQLVFHPNGAVVPADEPAVAAARAAHLAALATSGH